MVAPSRTAWLSESPASTLICTPSDFPEMTVPALEMVTVEPDRAAPSPETSADEPDNLISVAELSL